MPATRQSTVGELLLEVARSLPGDFTYEQLVVAAWNAHPKVFGLRGYENQFPSTNKVSAALYGARGLTGRGLIEPEGDRFFRCTRRGVEA